MSLNKQLFKQVAIETEHYDLHKGWIECWAVTVDGNSFN